MSFLCCGVKYSKYDINTYWCIETYLIKNFTKKKIKNKKVSKQIVETLLCTKNGCTKVHNKFFERGANGKFKILEVERFSGNEALEFLKATESIRVHVPQIEPVKAIPTAKNIDICFGKVIDSETQRARYLNDKDWQQGSENIHVPCAVTKIS